MGIVDWCISKVGCGYIYGAKGQTCTLAFRQQQANQYPEYADTILQTGAKWDGVPVWDCAQLTRYAAKTEGASFPSGATSQWNGVDWAETGEIASIPAEKVVFLYRKSGTKMQHTGIYLGDGTFVHAKGTKYGVLRENLGVYPWTHWGRIEIGQNGKTKEECTVLYEAKVINGNLNLRSGPSTSSSRIGQIPAGEKVSVIEEGTEWVKVLWNDTEGWCMRRYLEQIENEENTSAEAKSVRVYIQEAISAMQKALAAFDE